MASFVMNCVICHQNMHHIFSNIVMKKYDAHYWQCPECELIQVQDPHWLSEAYEEPIAKSDTGLVGRNVSLAARVSCLIFLLSKPQAKFLDIAGGYGMLTRLMRDYGFDYYWQDEYCKNLFAVGFEDDSSHQYSALTAFEVLEHIPDPLQFIDDVIRKYECNTLIFTTETFAGPHHPAQSWHYFSYETGQHITFYSHKTLGQLAQLLEMNFYCIRDIYIFTKKKIFFSSILGFISSARLAPFVARAIKWKLGTKTVIDSQAMLNS